MEGATDNPAVIARHRQNLCTLPIILFASTDTIMLTAILAVPRAAHRTSFAHFPEEDEGQRFVGGTLTPAEWEDPAIAGLDYRSRRRPSRDR